MSGVVAVLALFGRERTKIGGFDTAENLDSLAGKVFLVANQSQSRSVDRWLANSAIQPAGFPHGLKHQFLTVFPSQRLDSHQCLLFFGTLFFAHKLNSGPR